MKVAAIALLAFAPAWAQLAKPVAANAPVSVSPAPRPGIARATFDSLESQFDHELSSIGGLDHVDLLGPTRGLYLDDYGAVFTAEVSLIETPNSPFRPQIPPELRAGVHQRKLDHLPLLRQAMRDMVKNTAITFGALGVKMNILPPNAQVVLAVRLWYLPWEDRTGLPLYIVMKADVKGALAGDIKEEVQ